MIPKVLKNFNLFVDGRGYAGLVEEVTLPKLTLKTEEFQLGGLDTPVQMDMGMERLECGLRLREYDSYMISMLGIADRPEFLPTVQQQSADTLRSTVSGVVGIVSDTVLGGVFTNAVQPVSGDVMDALGIDKGLWRLTLRGGLSDETFGKVTPVVVGLAGGVTELDFGQWKAGESASLSIRLAVRYYHLTIGDKKLVEVDVDNRRRHIMG